MSKRLTKSRNNKVVAGVCGGIGEYFEVDPTIIRIVWVIMLFSGVGVLAYIIAALVMPEGSKSNNAFENPPVSNESSKNLLGVILIGLGSYWLIRRYIPWIDFDYMWPVALILVGGYLLFKEKQ